MSRLSRFVSSFSECCLHGIRWTIVTAIAVPLLFLCGPAQAQSIFASITGTVTDSSGAAVPGAKIVAKNVATNVETTTTSNDAGNYTVAQLILGTYTLTATASGFTTSASEPIATPSSAGGVSAAEPAFARCPF